MRNAVVVPAVVLGLAMVGVPLAAQTRTPAIVYGRVVDRNGGDPVVAADLWLEKTNLHRISDSDGRFDFGEVPPGSYLFHVQHIGYQEFADTLKVVAGKYLDMDVQLAPKAVKLKPIVVVAEYDAGKMSGFYERRRFTLGTFVTRQDIDRERPQQTSDLFRTIRGVHLVPASGSGLGLGYHVLMRNNCRPALFLDGTQTAPTAMSIDDLVRPNEIEAIEVYRGAETPPQYQRNSCGAILVWTRPGGGHGHLSFWKAALIVGVGATLILLFSH